jgi:spore coat protein A
MKRQLFNRRQFLQRTGLTAAGFFALQRKGWAAYNSPGLLKFHPQNPLRQLGTSGNALLIAASDGTVINSGIPATHYTINIGEFQDQLHPSLPPTTLWGYYQGDVANARHLGGIIVANKNVPVQLTFVNKLPATHILPIDTSGFFTDANNHRNKTVVHLHGGFIPWISDGGPYDYWTPDGTKGHSFKNHVIKDHVADGNLDRAEYYWPNQQSARLMWYHEHAHEFTRLNAYAGVASGYVLMDPFELGLIGGVLPLTQIPLIFQDKVFVGQGGAPGYPGKNEHGSLWYPYEYDPVDVGPSPFKDPTNPVPPVSAVPEMFGDTILVNGTAYPFLNVEPRRYRFRVLNACNARFMNLCLYVKDHADGLALHSEGGLMVPNSLSAGPPMVQLGTEGGFLPAPVVLNSPPRPMGFTAAGVPNRYNLLLAPAERADIVIDFKAFAGKTLILYSDAPAPFPSGDAGMDYFRGMGAFPGAPTQDGYGPNTRTLLQIVVAPTTSSPDPVPYATWLANARTALGSRISELIPPPQAGAPRRVVTLNETHDEEGRLIQMLGTDQPNPIAPSTYGRWYTQQATEVVNQNAIEVWEIYNLTEDAHPMHFHLANVQIVNRQPFNPDAWPAKVFTGPSRLPDANERGWKETVRMNPGEVTRVVWKFELPTVPFAMPTSPPEKLGLANPPAGKVYHEYVWHCHILEHEEHDMMRPLVVVGNP